MPNSFLFIIPLTPASHLSETRKILRKLCFETLNKQNYSNWKALLIGNKEGIEVNNDKFISLEVDGVKEEKLQLATSFILNNNIEGDYLIRLDDDDIFNPAILFGLKDKKFDLFVDKYQSHWNYANGYISQEVRYWFPNTCIHKREHALKKFGKFPEGEYKRFKDEPMLIETEHNDFHLYYDQNHKIEFATKSDPVYLRVLSSNSITANQEQNFEDYLNKYGYWHFNKLKAFYFLNHVIANKQMFKKQGFTFFLKNLKNNIIANKNYKKIVIDKN